MSYSEDFRKRTIAYKLEGHTLEETSKIFKIGITTIKRWINMSKTGGLSDPPRKSFFRKIDPEKLKGYIENNPSSYLSEIAQKFDCSIPSIHAALNKLGYTRKKRSNAIGNKTQKK